MPSRYGSGNGSHSATSPRSPPMSGQVGRARPAQPRVDDQVAQPHHGHGDRPARPRPRAAARPPAARAAARRRQDGQQQHHRDRGQRAHPGGQGGAEREPGERRARAPAAPRARHAAHTATSRKPAAGTSRVASEPCAMTSGEKANSASATSPPTGPERSRANSRTTTPNSQRQRDHRQPGEQQQPPGIVARLVEQRAGPARSGRRRSAGSSRGVGERQPGPDQRLAQRRMLGVVAQAVLLPLHHGGPGVHRLVDRRRLLHRRRDHGHGHLAEQRDRRHGQQPPPGGRARVGRIYGRLGVRSSIPHGEPYAPASRSRNGWARTPRDRARRCPTRRRWPAAPARPPG